MAPSKTDGELSDAAYFAQFSHMVTAAVVSLITEGWTRQSYAAMLAKLGDWIVAEIDRISEEPHANLQP